MLTVIRPYMTAAMVVRGLRISSHVAPSFNSFRSKTRPLATLFISFPPPTAGGVRRMSSSVRATPYHQQVNDSGSIDSPLMQSMHNKIKEQLNADVVVVEDANGDGRHVRINVISTAFEGQSAVNRQRMVYKAISEELQSVVHAVDQMITKTPAEAEENR